MQIVEIEESRSSLQEDVMSPTKKIVFSSNKKDSIKNAVFESDKSSPRIDYDDIILNDMKEV